MRSPLLSVILCQVPAFWASLGSRGNTVSAFAHCCEPTPGSPGPLRSVSVSRPHHLGGTMCYKLLVHPLLTPSSQISLLGFGTYCARSLHCFTEMASNTKSSEHLHLDAKLLTLQYLFSFLLFLCPFLPPHKCIFKIFLAEPKNSVYFYTLNLG